MFSQRIPRLLFISVAALSTTSAQVREKVGIGPEQQLGTPAGVTHARYFDTSGWQMPGFRYFETMEPDKVWTAAIDGKTVTVSQWRVDRILRQQGRCNAALIPHGASIANGMLKLVEIAVSAFDVRRYSFNGQSFLYEMDAVPCTQDSTAGSVELIAFYDDDGDGCFELLEYKDTRIPPANPWRARLATWITQPPEKKPRRCDASSSRLRPEVALPQE